MALLRLLTRTHLLPALLLALLLAGTLAPAAPAWAEPGAPLIEHQVKAAYLYKFTGFVEWPEGSFARADSPILIGVAGNEALAEQLEQIVAGRSANGHPIEIRRLKRGEPPGALHIVYIGGNDRALVSELLAATRGQPVLTVSDSDTAFSLGCMINFVVADERLRFQVALKPVASSRLRISARMLAAAQKVHTEGVS
ncbi:MAG: YfiR family protein [Pseudomonadota bacterium]